MEFSDNDVFIQTGALDCVYPVPYSLLQNIHTNSTIKLPLASGYIAPFICTQQNNQTSNTEYENNSIEGYLEMITHIIPSLHNEKNI